MPVSRSPNRGADAAARPRTIWPIALIGLAALLAVSIAALPASAVAHFLPQALHAEDFSGSIWHGSAGKISVNGRDAGAIEWRLHPAALLSMAIAADLHWVKIGFVVDAAATLDRRGFAAHAVEGGGPIEDLRDLGVAPGWRGTAALTFGKLAGDFSKPLAAVGDIRVSNLTSAQFAQGTDLGSYVLHFPEDAVDADGNLSARLVDAGGPLDLQTQVRYSANERSVTLSGTIKERPDTAAVLRSQIDNLAQMRGRDPHGRIPVDLEFRLQAAE